MTSDPLLPPLPALLLLTGWILLLALTRLPVLGCRFPSLTRDTAAAAGLAALCALFHWRVLFTREAGVPAGGGDFNAFYFPLARFAADQIQAGRLPLWNPTLFTGMPLAADFQVGLLYPPNLLAFLLARPFEYGALEALAVGHYWLASLTAYALWRSLGGSIPAALVAGVTYAYGGFLVAHLGHPPMLGVAAWLPLFLLCLRLALRRRSPRAVAAAALTLALMILAGHPQMLLLGLSAAAAWGALVAWQTRPTTSAQPASTPPTARSGLAAWVADPRLRHWSVSGIIGVAIAGLGAALAAPVLLPALQLGRHSVRATLSYAESTAFSLRPLHLIHLLVPKAFGDSPTSYLNAIGFNGEVWAYAGVVTLLLAAAAVVWRPHPAALFGLGLAAVALLLMLGPATPLQGWLYRFVPGFGQVRAPGRWSLLYSLGLALAAAGGIDALRNHLPASSSAALRRSGRWLGLVAASILFLLGLLTGQLLAPREPSAPLANFLDGLGWLFLLLVLSLGLLRWLRRGAPSRAAAGALLAGLVVLDLFSAHAAFNPTTADLTAGFRHAEIVAALHAAPGPIRLDTNTGTPDLWQPSTAALLGLQDIGGAFNPLGLTSYVTLYDLARRDRTGPLYELFGVTHVVARPDKLPRSSGLTPLLTAPSKLVLYERHGGLPRAYIVAQARTFDTPEAALAALRAPGFDPRAEVLLVGGRPLVSAGTAAPARPAGIVRQEPDLLELSATADGDAYLVVADAYYPGWRAEVDGQPAPVERANYAFRAVPIPAGAHTIRLIFDPPLWRIGWLLALAAAIALLALLILPSLLRPRNARRHAAAGAPRSERQ